MNVKGKYWLIFTENKEREMIFTDKKDIKIESDIEPCVGARIVLPCMTKQEKRDIEKKPFINKKNVNYFINYKGEEFTIFIPKSYTWDGASIPFGFRWILGGKGNPKFLVASCVHDKMCENKYLVNYNRKLSSIIFKELLLSCGLSKIKANIMFQTVNNYQRMVRGWRNG